MVASGGIMKGRYAWYRGYWRGSGLGFGRGPLGESAFSPINSAACARIRLSARRGGLRANRSRARRATMRFGSTGLAGRISRDTSGGVPGGVLRTPAADIFARCSACSLPGMRDMPSSRGRGAIQSVDLPGCGQARATHRLRNGKALHAAVAAQRAALPARTQADGRGNRHARPLG